MESIFVLIILLTSFLLNVEILGASKESRKKGDKTWTPPWFDQTLPDLIRVTEGQKAELSCSVHRLRGRAVSWIRQADLHVISTNSLTFTSDDRFKVVVDNASSLWTLQILPALRDDAGYYECQVNTRPKLSWPVFLDVEVPAAQLEGPSERYIQSGSTLVLTCNSTLHPDAMTSVIWYHNSTAVNITSPRGGLSIQTVRDGRHVLSRLSVVRAQPADAGLYTCSPDLVFSANATVFVVKGEHRAAMHHDDASHCSSSINLLTFLLFINTLNYFQMYLYERRQLALIGIIVASIITCANCHQQEEVFDNKLSQIPCSLLSMLQLKIENCRVNSIETFNGSIFTHELNEYLEDIFAFNKKNNSLAL